MATAAVTTDTSKTASVAVGIDLGTSFSAVAIYKTGEHKVRVLKDKKGRVVLPSMVAFTNIRPLLGYDALAQIDKNPENTVAEVKRLLGRKFNEPQVQQDMRRWPFTLLDVNGEPRLQVQFRRETRQFLPEQIAAFLLGHLRVMVNEALGQVAVAKFDVVLTVPVDFGDPQRHAIKEACKIAGLNVIKFITEPAAAALAYAWNEMIQEDGETEDGLVLVFDMGGGTTDVCVLKLAADHQYEVVSCKGNNRLGGEDIDTLFVEHCLASCTPEDKVKIKANNGALIRLRRTCEEAKVTLSTKDRATLVADEIVPGLDFKLKITRDQFEQLIKNLLKDAVSLVDICMQEAGLPANDIKQLLLAGGSSRIPLIQDLLRDALPGVPLHTSMSQDEAVACGAALQAAKDKGILEVDIRLTERIPWSLGIDLACGTMNKVIWKNTKIPIKNDVVYHTCFPNQTEMIFDIYEGEAEKSKENKFLATMALSGIRKAPACEIAADTCFEIDDHGILQVTATEQGNNNRISVKIDRYKKILTEEEVTKLNQENEGDELHGLVHQLRDQVEVMRMDVVLSADQKENLEHQAVVLKQFTDSNPRPTAASFNQLVQNVRQNLEPYGVEVSSVGNITLKP